MQTVEILNSHNTNNKLPNRKHTKKYNYIRKLNIPNLYRMWGSFMCYFKRIYVNVEK